MAYQKKKGSFFFLSRRNIPITMNDELRYAHRFGRPRGLLCLDRGVPEINWKEFAKNNFEKEAKSTNLNHLARPKTYLRSFERDRSFGLIELPRSESGVLTQRPNTYARGGGRRFSSVMMAVQSTAARIVRDVNTFELTESCSRVAPRATMACLSQSFKSMLLPCPNTACMVTGLHSYLICASDSLPLRGH